MNWNQINASANPEEQIEAITLMLRTLQTRRNRRIVSRGRLIHERRGAFPGAHFVNQRRRRLIPRPVYLASFMLILAVASIGVWISFFHLPPVYAAPLMLIHLTMLSAILIIKPYKLHPAASYTSQTSYTS